MGDTNIRNAHLQHLHADTVGVIDQVRALFKQHSEYQLTWKPRQDMWSMTENFAHLLQTGEVYYPRIREAIRYVREHDMREREPYRPSFVSRRFIKMLGPESRLKVRTFKVFVPAHASWDATLEPRFTKQQEELLEMIRQADGYDLNRVKFPSALTRFLRFSIGEGLAVVVTHMRRHVRQARGVCEQDGFPQE